MTRLSRSERRQASPIWGITAYYNPLHHLRRLRNYRHFRRELEIPLIAVEAVYDDRADLVEEDAEAVVQLRGSAVLWQKERLLNVALRHLPPHVEYVAWLDSDVVLKRTDWADEAVRLLQTFPIVQLFSKAHDLSRDEDPADLNDNPRAASGTSVVHLMNTGDWTVADFRPATTQRVRHCLFGLAWAARRGLLEKHGFYDALILGSGDRAMACAAFGRFDDAVTWACLDPRRSAHYLAWAVPYHEDVRGEVGCIEGTLCHLWHGDVAGRRYVQRHVELARLGFDPYADIAADGKGPWRWASQKEDLHDYILRYFRSRNDNG